MGRVYGLVAVAVAANIIAAGAAFAEGGFYIGLEGGASLFQDDDSYRTSANDANLPNPDTAVGKADGDTGYLVGALVGYDMGSGIRWEAEATYRAGVEASSKLVDYASGGGDNQTFLSSADISTTTVMAVANFDIATLLDKDMGRINPFIGVGLGASYNEIGSSSPVLATGWPLGTVPGDSHWDFAWKVEAGTGIKVGEKTYLDLAYSYSDLGTAEPADGVSLNYGVFLIDAGAIDLQSHEVTIGMRFLLY